MATVNYITIPNIGAFQAVWDKAPAIVAAELASATKIATLATQALASKEAPVRTGYLATHIEATSIGNVGTVFVPPTLKYAIYVSEGTGLYGKYASLIYPTTKKVLATKVNPGWGSSSNGYYIIGKYSKGQKPNPFMTRAKDAAVAPVNKSFQVALQNIIEGLSF